MTKFEFYQNEINLLTRIQKKPNEEFYKIISSLKKLQMEMTIKEGSEEL